MMMNKQAAAIVDALEGIETAMVAIKSAVEQIAVNTTPAETPEESPAETPAGT